MAFIPIAVGHTAARHEKTIVALLRERHAVRRETAQPLTDLSKMQRRFLERAVDRGTVRLVAGNRYYIDEDALREYRGRLVALAFSILVVAAGVAAAFALI
jgi:hypothetical protein